MRPATRWSSPSAATTPCTSMTAGRATSIWAATSPEISATTDSTLYVRGEDLNSVYVNSGSGYVDLGGYAKQISAGLDAAGNPEVFAIGGDNAVYINDNGTGWVDLGGYGKAISASVDNTVFAISGDNAVYVNQRVGLGRPGRRHQGDQRRPRRGRQPGGLRHRQRQRRVRQRQRDRLGRPGRLRQGDQRDRRTTRSSPSAATMPCTSTRRVGLGRPGRLRQGDQRRHRCVDRGNPEVFAIGGDNAVYLSDNGIRASSTSAATSRRSARRADGTVLRPGRGVDTLSYVNHLRVGLQLPGLTPARQPG